MPEINGDLDLADIDTNQPVPEDWGPESDDSVFDAQDKDDDPDG